MIGWLIIEDDMSSNNEYLENTSLKQSKSLTCLSMANRFDRKMNFQGDVLFWLLTEVFWLFISKSQVLFFELIIFSKRSNAVTNISCWTNFFSYPGTTLFHLILPEVKKKKKKIQVSMKSVHPFPTLPHSLSHSHTQEHEMHYDNLFQK